MNKSIRYFKYRAPIIKKFIDDAGVLPMNIDPNIDKNAVDPFSVLFRTIEQLKSEQRCQNEYNVMDGKRRYKIIVELINKYLLLFSFQRDFSQRLQGVQACALDQLPCKTP